VEYSCTINEPFIFVTRPLLLPLTIQPPSSPRRISCTGSDIQHCSSSGEASKVNPLYRTDSFVSKLYLLLLTARVLRDLVTRAHGLSVTYSFQRLTSNDSGRRRCDDMDRVADFDIHVFLEPLEMFVLLCELLLELQELLLLPHADGVVLLGFLAPGEGIAVGIGRLALTFLTWPAAESREWSYILLYDATASWGSSVTSSHCSRGGCEGSSRLQGRTKSWSNSFYDGLTVHIVEIGWVDWNWRGSLGLCTVLRGSRLMVGDGSL